MKGHIMRTLKFLGTIFVGFTLGEFITLYRQQPENVELKDFAKKYLDSVTNGVKAGYKIGERFWDEPEEAKRDFKKIMLS